MNCKFNIWDIQLGLILVSVLSYAFLNLGFLPLNISNIIILFVLIKISVNPVYYTHMNLPKIYSV